MPYVITNIRCVHILFFLALERNVYDVLTVSYNPFHVEPQIAEYRLFPIHLGPCVYIARIHIH